MSDLESLWLLVMYLPIVIGLRGLVGNSRYFYLLILSFWLGLGAYLLILLPSYFSLFISFCFGFSLSWFLASKDLKLKIMESSQQFQWALFMLIVWWSDRVVMDFRASLVFSLLLLSVGMLVAFFSSSGENRTRGILALLVVMFLIASYYMIEFDIHGVASDSIYSSLGLAGIAVASCSLLGVFPFHYVWVEYEKHLSKDRLLSYYFLRILLSYQLLSFLTQIYQAYPQLVKILALLSLVSILLYNLLDLVEVEAYGANSLDFNRMFLVGVSYYLYACFYQDEDYFEIFALAALLLAVFRLSLIRKQIELLGLPIDSRLLKSELFSASKTRLGFLLSLSLSYLVYLSLTKWLVRFSLFENLTLITVILLGGYSLYVEWKYKVPNPRG